MEENVKILAEIARMKEIKRFAIKELKRMPEGTLRISNDKNGNPRYYHYIASNDEEKHLDKYISKRKDLGKIKKLAQKAYLEEILKVAENNLKLLTKEICMSEYQSVEKIFETLPESRKQLVTPIEQINVEKANQWASLPFTPNPYHPENLTLETEHGEMVRSKSERFIANMLFHRNEKLVYKYEAPLILKDKIIYPDFTIMRKSDGKIFYWEHAGMMDDADYVEGHIEKMNDYFNGNIMPGKQLIVTYESSRVPLDTEPVKKLMDYYF